MFTLFTSPGMDRRVLTMDAASPSSEPPRSSYHHGDLRASLVRAGYALARAGGARAVTLRATTRRAGVSAPAAYRHFAGHDELLRAVSLLALADMARRIEATQAEVTASAPAERALALLDAVGRGYVAFALDEPRAFDVALFAQLTMADALHPDAAGDTGRTAYGLFQEALTGLVGVGLVAPAAAELASVHCWSVVHGFAALATTGPLRLTPRPELDALAAALVREVVDAVTGARARR